MFNLHIVTQLKTKSNVSNEYILKLWVSKTKKTWSFNENIDESEISVMNNLQRGSIFAELFIDKEIENWKGKKITNSCVPNDWFLFINEKSYYYLND